MKKRLILTSPDLVIYDPVTRLRVPADGIDADPQDPFWRRRLKERSMVEAAPVPVPVPAPQNVKQRHLMAEPPKA